MLEYHRLGKNRGTGAYMCSKPFPSTATHLHPSQVARMPASSLDNYATFKKYCSNARRGILVIEFEATAIPNP